MYATMVRDSGYGLCIRETYCDLDEAFDNIDDDVREIWEVEGEVPYYTQVRVIADREMIVETLEGL